MCTYYTFGFLMAEQGLAASCSKSQEKYAGKAKLAAAPSNSIMADTTPSHSSGLCSLEALVGTVIGPSCYLGKVTGSLTCTWHSQGVGRCLLGLVLSDHNSRICCENMGFDEINQLEKPEHSRGWYILHYLSSFSLVWLKQDIGVKEVKGF